MIDYLPSVLTRLIDVAILVDFLLWSRDVGTLRPNKMLRFDFGLNASKMSSIFLWDFCTKILLRGASDVKDYAMLTLFVISNWLSSSMTASINYSCKWTRDLESPFTDEFLFTLICGTYNSDDAISSLDKSCLIIAFAIDTFFLLRDRSGL